MTRTVALTTSLHKAPTRASAVRPLHENLRVAMERTGWTHEALACYWKCERTRVTKKVNGSRPVSARDINALPPDLRTMLAVVELEAVGGVAVLPPSDRELQRMVLALSAALQTVTPPGGLR